MGVLRERGSERGRERADYVVGVGGMGNGNKGYVDGRGKGNGEPGTLTRVKGGGGGRIGGTEGSRPVY